MKLSVIIVSWNVKDLLRKCLTSIFASDGDFELEVFVVDNASGDGSADAVEKEFPKVKLIASEKNLGFSKGNNMAIEKATGDYILLLNPDTEVYPDTFSGSIKFMKNHSDCGLMGCQLLNTDKTLQPSVRMFPTVLPIFLMLLKLPKLFPNLKSINKYLAKDFDYTKTQSTQQVMGAYMFISREVIDKIGGLDERFFVWFDDSDYCKRVVDAGYKVYYYNGVKIIHHLGRAFAQHAVISKQWHFFKSALLYFLKHGIK